MENDKEILAKIKSIVLEEIPDAQLYLFGSRATGKIHEESDWDILAITQREIPKDLKKRIRRKLYPQPDEDYFFVDLTIVDKKNWVKNPSYYVLRESIKNEVVAI